MSVYVGRDVFPVARRQVAAINPFMTCGARLYAVVVTALVFCPMVQLLAEEKEPFAVVELGAATERSIQEAPTAPGLRRRLSFRSSRIGWKSRRASHHYSAQVRPSGRLISFQEALHHQRACRVHDRRGPAVELRNCGRRNADCRARSPWSG